MKGKKESVMGKNYSRTKNMILNIATGTAGEIIQLLLQFICRTIFIYTLSAEYLGINGLFENILKLLSLTELGFGSALIYSMYKPIAEGDQKQICALMNLYRKIYSIIGCIILGLGLLLVPFLPYLIKGGTSIPNLSLIYILVLLNSVSTYFLGYRSSIINASQKKYITISIQKIFAVAEVLLKTFILLYFKAYIIYLCIGIICNVCSNITQYIVANKMYPYLKEDKKALPNATERKEIFKNTKAMAMHKIGSVIVTGTDNLLISAFVNIASVGIYSNYTLILNSVSRFTDLIGSTMTASVGNLVATCDMKRVYKTYCKITFMNIWIHGFCACCFMTLFNAFITVWIGNQFTFPEYVVALIVINRFLTGFRDSTLIFRDAMGLFWYDRYKPILEIIVNLVVSIILVQFIGISGVFLGTIVSSIGVCCWIEPYVLFKYGFKMKVSYYYLKVIPFVIPFFISTILLYVIEIRVPLTVVGLIIRGGISVIGYNLIMLMFFHRMEEFKELKETTIAYLKKIFKKK